MAEYFLFALKRVCSRAVCYCCWLSASRRYTNYTKWLSLLGMNVAFETPLKEIAGLNRELVRLLEQELHIATVEEALLYLPFRYVDRRFFVPVDDVRGPDGMVQVVGVVSQMEVVGQGRKQRLVAKLQGSRRSIDVVWFRGVPLPSDSHR